jgi:hypothetical protein
MLSHQTLVRAPVDRIALPSHALSIRQPWTWAILYAGKRVENRTWATLFRGPIFLHAGMAVDWESLDDLAAEIRAVSEPRPAAVRGALVATAQLVGCVRPESAPTGQRRWVAGPWCFLLEDVKPLAEPIACGGRLGIFPVEAKSTM